MALLPFSGAPYSVKIDTKDNVLANTPNSHVIYFTSDTFEVYLSDGTSWYTSPFWFVINPQAPDIGFSQISSRIGYGVDYISDKVIANSRIGANDVMINGALRTTPTVGLQVYFGGKYNDVVINFNLREDPNNSYDIQHKPVGFIEWIEIYSGNSVTLGLNNKPLIQGYSASMGCYPVDPTIDGGTV